MFLNQVLIVNNEPLLNRSLSESFKRHGFDVQLASNGREALEIFDHKTTKLVISDLEMPYMDGMQLLKRIKSIANDTHMVLVTACGSIDKAVESLKLGAYDYIEKPLTKDKIDNLIESILKSQTSTDFEKTLKKSRFPHIVTQSPKMFEIMEIAKSIATTNATVLLEGESGTGKELMANFIHYHSNKKKGSFLAVNCAALPENLLESELFGHEKGAFTGAVNKRRGIFERAHQGTLFMDEIGEIGLPLQAKLLRVLQERNFERIGGESIVNVDVRIISSTNLNLLQEVNNNKFREDLYYRINVIPLFLPSLRERPEDIPVLTEHFINKYNKMYNLKIENISKDALNILMDHSWPGNVRELENTIERSTIIKKRGSLEKRDFWFPNMRRPVMMNKSEHKPKLPEHTKPVQDLQKEYIVETLRKFNGNRTQTANALGLSVRTIRNRIRDYRELGIEL